MPNSMYKRVVFTLYTLIITGEFYVHTCMYIPHRDRDLNRYDVVLNLYTIYLLEAGILR